jgi:hypothetical protein
VGDIFVVGSPRSGTSWLQGLLAEHPVLASPPESYLFPDFLGPCEAHWHASVGRNRSSHDAGADGNGLDELLDREAFVEWMRNLYGEARRAALELKPGATRLLEKTPDNARHLPLIREIVPDACFVHIVRDPKDVVASLLERHRRPFGEWAPSDVLTATRIWLGNVSAALRDGDPTDTLPIRYEDLKADAHKVLQRVTDFAGLPGRVDEWFRGDPRARPADRLEFIVRRPDRLAANGHGDANRERRVPAGPPTTTALSELECWYVESRCFAEMAEFGYPPSVFEPGRESPGRRAEVALRLQAPQLARRIVARARRELQRSG